MSLLFDFWTASCVITPEQNQNIGNCQMFLSIFRKYTSEKLQMPLRRPSTVPHWYSYSKVNTVCSVPAVDWTTLSDSLLFSGYPSAYTQLATEQISVFLQPWAECKAEPLIIQHPFVLNLLQRFSNLLCPRLTEGRGQFSGHTCLFFFFIC